MRLRRQLEAFMQKANYVPTITLKKKKKKKKAKRGWKKAEVVHSENTATRAGKSGTKSMFDKMGNTKKKSKKVKSISVRKYDKSKKKYMKVYGRDVEYEVPESIKKAAKKVSSTRTGKPTIKKTKKKKSMTLIPKRKPTKLQKARQTTDSTGQVELEKLRLQNTIKERRRLKKMFKGM